MESGVEEIQFNLFRRAKRLSTVIKVCSHNKTEKKQKQKKQKQKASNCQLKKYATKLLKNLKKKLTKLLKKFQKK